MKWKSQTLEVTFHATKSQENHKHVKYYRSWGNRTM
jgi:hypothetical protein